MKFKEILNEGFNYTVELTWKGLSGDKSEIDIITVSEKTLDKLEKEFSGDISFDVVDETLRKPIKYKEALAIIKGEAKKVFG
jgi:hypothetical protein